MIVNLYLVNQTTDAESIEACEVTLAYLSNCASMAGISCGSSGKQRTAWPTTAAALHRCSSSCVFRRLAWRDLPAPQSKSQSQRGTDEKANPLLR